MEYTKIGKINEYVSQSINPMKTPDTVFEMYSVPVFDTGHPEYLRGDEIASSKIVVQKDDILLCKINPRINRVWVVDDESDKQNIASSEWIVIRNSAYNPEFLAWYFRTPKFQKLMTSEVTGIGGSLTRAQPKRVAEYPVPILERSRQDKIVCALNKVKHIIDVRRRELDELDNLNKSRFVEMFGGKYKTVKLGDVVKTTSGGTPSKSHPEYYESGTIPWLTSGEVNAGVITSVKNYITDLGMKNSSAKMVPANSVVIAMYGATAGVTGLIRLDTTTNQAVCSILPSERFVPEYLYYAVASQKDWMISQCQGGGQPNISQGIIKNMDIIDAPTEEQMRFADFVIQVDKLKFWNTKIINTQYTKG